MDPGVELGPYQGKSQMAVCVRKAFKQYGIKTNRVVVLNGLNMTVEKGTIYGLLGASGCGKTTLLTCIVGRRRVNAGNLWVLGGKPGEEGSGVPGPRIGYMPQELSLIPEFTITETFKYFGWICGLKSAYIRKRTKELANFLELPSPTHIVGELSGGQQRRVSFAAALLHDPELLILDEPTVGVDPVLRQNIWDYLIEITTQSQKTVIITTHYIEEARQAQAIGLMREGVLLAEDSPNNLLRRFQCESLEEVFLNLSVRQQRDQDKTDVVPALEFKQSEFHEVNDNISPDYSSDTISNYAYNSENYEDFNTMPSFNNHLRALIWKNILWIRRNIPVILFLFVLPVVQVVLFCTAIGRDPQYLHLAVVNDELNPYQSCDSFLPTNHSACNMSMLSCQYLHHLANRTTYIQDRFQSMQDAKLAVRRGYAWGVLHFTPNYTEALVERIDLGSHATEGIVENADIIVNLDMSNQAIGILLMRDITYSFLHFIHHVLSTCEWNPRVVDIPVHFHEPIYGDIHPRFIDFTSPGSLLAMVFILAVALTAGSMLTEKKEGVIERCLVLGVNMQEVLLSHIIVEFVIMFGQCTMCLFCSFVVFDIQNVGPWSLVISLTLLQGVNGMCLGFLLSAVCESQVMATLVGVGYFLAILFMSGILWPIEGMYWMLQYTVIFSPLTHATEAMRSIMLRGWNVTQPSVYWGFISTCVWIVIYLSLTLIGLRIKKALH